MHVTTRTFEEKMPRDPGWSENCFSYCEFTRIEGEGDHVDSVFQDCRFVECDWYWALFNLSVFVGAEFKNCTFRGCSFADCAFVECEFVDCRFTVDNFGRVCSFEGSRWYACKQSNTVGIEASFPNAL